MKVNTKIALKLAAAALTAVGVAAVLSGCMETVQQDPVEKEFKLKNGDTVKCLVIYDEYGEIIEETVTCSPIEAAGQPTAK